MINTFISNFREKHGFNKHTTMLPYNDEGDSEEEPIHLEGGRRVVLHWKIISPRDSSTQDEGDDHLYDLVSRSRKRPTPTRTKNQWVPLPRRQRKKRRQRCRGQRRLPNQKRTLNRRRILSPRSQRKRRQRSRARTTPNRFLLWARESQNLASHQGESHVPVQIRSIHSQEIHLPCIQKGTPPH